jgi:hypothetical protein
VNARIDNLLAPHNDAGKSLHHCITASLHHCIIASLHDAELAIEAGLPPGLLNIVICSPDG